jgi:hypothetical protein
LRTIDHFGGSLAPVRTNGHGSMETGSMKSAIRYSALAAVLAVAPPVQLHAASSSSTPAAESARAAHTYPSLLPLTLQVRGNQTHELGKLRDMTITVQREGDYAPLLVLAPVSPFTERNLCLDPMPKGIAGCLVNGDATVGTLRVDWQVPQAGTYHFVFSGKRGTSDRVETLGAFDLEARE